MFTQSCFIKKNTPELRKKLEELGYKNLEKVRYYGDPIYIYCEKDIFYTSPCKLKIHDTYRIDCETNEELFLALAALRDDTDKYQWVIDEANECFGWENSWSICDKDDMNESVVYTHYRKATVEEIIENFK